MQTTTNDCGRGGFGVAVHGVRSGAGGAGDGDSSDSGGGSGGNHRGRGGIGSFVDVKASLGNWEDSYCTSLLMKFAFLGFGICA